MPRQLPWKVGPTAAKKAPSRLKAVASPTPSASRSPAPSHRPTPAPKSESTPDPSRKARRSVGLSTARSPSTSPPPEPLKEEFMIEGVDNDDKYRMVEDEFLAVAGEFTRHLHAAEYQRLKGLANSHNAEAIQNISRPVTGEMTDLVKRRHAALDTAVKQRKGIAKTLGKRGARDHSLSPRPATSLRGLMDSPRKQAVPLTSITGTRPGSSFRDMDTSPSRRPRRPRSPETRVKRHSSDMGMQDRKGQESMVRFNREPTPDSDDDDLDSRPRWSSKYKDARRPDKADNSLQQPRAEAKPVRSKTEPSAPCNPFFTASNAPRPILPRSTSLNERVDSPNDDVVNGDDDDDPFSRMRARRAAQKRRREVKLEESAIKTSESQAAALNEIPFI